MEKCPANRLILMIVQSFTKTGIPGFIKLLPITDLSGRCRIMQIIKYGHTGGMQMQRKRILAVLLKQQVPMPVAFTCGKVLTRVHQTLAETLVPAVLTLWNCALPKLY